MGLFHICTRPQHLSLLSSISLRKPADDDRFLMRIDFENPLVGLKIIDIVFHNHIQNQDHAITVEIAIRQEDVVVGMKSEKIAENIDGNDGAENGIIFRYCLLEKNLYFVHRNMAESCLYQPPVKNPLNGIALISILLI